ncbi:MAG: alanine--tRNA ligase, partial [Deltaproteobacteria bacterium]|nr:alanine--tRNA ligase [Deltaproteobacteria bacterium]
CLEVVRQMGNVYPELPERQDLIDKATRLEEETFRHTLENWLKILKKEISELKGQGQQTLPGSLVFDLQTRDGFPPDLTAVIAAEHGFSIDQAAYRKAFAHHQQVSGGSLGLKGVDDVFRTIAAKTGPTEFLGYDDAQASGTIQALITFKEKTDDKGRKQVVSRSQIEQASASQVVEAIISATPCYGETGGQVGDKGTLTSPAGQAEIVDAQRPLQGTIVHRLKVTQGVLAVGDQVQLKIDSQRRGNIQRNHSATHLLQTALRKVLGSHVNQSGSLVDSDRFRFDFSHFAQMTAEEISAIEREVNRMIRENYKIEVTVKNIEQAREMGATMLFGERYDQQVRVVSMGEDSLELCGGTHAARTGDIGLFKIISEGSIKAGVRRIEAVTGDQALSRFQELERRLSQATNVLKTTPGLLVERIQTVKKRESELTREVDKLKQQLATSGAAGDPAQAAKEIEGVKVLALQAKGIALAGLREFADNLRDRLNQGIVLAFAEDQGKLSAVCTVGKELTGKLKAGDLLKAVLEVTGGKGGGRPDFAQGGGGDPAKLDQGIAAFYSLVEKSLTS